ncbi:MAG: T9SS type A sorting domain-containing protein [Lunatimonas sp.]|uniref:T9SS type A sorting domain-containing protein n=1 Tax=Lunatimonas sp. TaxID=2060141 RepID=UPI00263AE853|nr:T9SS type A sorting domain-containing protein [Lunatimonas sp.]MCC5937318.1 T9SS type A sorting domain-containing protein [Lunatimonas sp.]
MRILSLVIWLVLSLSFSGIGQIARFEYFIDSDPGVGRATAFSVGNGASVEGTFSIPLSSVEVGVHQLGVRTFDAQGKASQTYLHPFYLLATNGGQIDEVEYFIDVDPGFGNATKVAPAFGEDGFMNYTIPLSSIEPGHRMLGMRTKNQSGVWSSTKLWSFYNREGHLPTHIVRLEYYFTGANAPNTTYVYDLPEPAGSVDLTSILSLEDLQDGGTYTVHVTVIDEHGFRSNRAEASFAVAARVAIEEIEAVDVTCFGGSDGKATITAGAGDQTLEYSLNGQTFSNSNMFEGLEAGTYTAYVRSISHPDIVVEEEFTVGSPVELKLAFEDIVDPGCPDDETGSFRVTPSGGAGGYEIRIGTQGTFQTATVFASLTPGTYQVTVRDGNGCEASAEVTLTSSGQAPPKPTVEISGNPGISQELSLISSSTSGNQWHKDGVAIPGATQQSLSITEAGTYHVVVTGTGGCTSISDMTAITSSTEEVRSVSIQLYPNPADNSTTVRFGRETYVDRVAIYSTTGVLLRESRELLSVERVFIDLSGLPAGSYYVQVQGIGLMERLRLIKK